MDDSIRPIGVDPGYGDTKTRNSCFRSGVTVVSDPIVYDNVLEYKGIFYRIGVIRTMIQENRYSNDDILVLTMAAIARELKILGLRGCTIVLAVGLPIGRFSAEKKELISYLSREKMLSFRFEKVPYTVKIDKVLVYPQCYGAIFDKLETMSDFEYVVDIGSWTVDILKVVDKVPDESGCSSEPDGVITCIRRIQEVCYEKLNSKIDEHVIREVIIKGEAALEDEYIDIINTEVKRYCESIYKSLLEKGINVRTTPITFVGGGANLMKRYMDPKQRNLSYITDVRANAIGYEKMAKLYLKKRSGLK